MGDEQPNCRTLLGPILHKGCASSPATSLPCLRLSSSPPPSPLPGRSAMVQPLQKGHFSNPGAKQKKKIFSHNPVIFPLIYPCGGVPASSRWSSGELGRKKSFFALKIVSTQLTHIRYRSPSAKQLGYPGHLGDR